MIVQTLRRLFTATLILGLGSTMAQTYPAKPIRLVVPYSAGGPLDVAARTLASEVRGSLGTVIIENKVGAGGNIGADAVAKAPADGYTLLIGAVATHAINPSLYAKMPYDAAKDFAPITLISHVPNVLVLNSDFAARHQIESLADLIDYAKSHPNELAYGSGGSGSAGHLAGEMLKQRTGIDMVHVPYRGASPAQMGLMGGEVQLMFDNLASAAPRIKEGKLKALGLTTTEPSPAFPDMPTLSGSGIAELNDFEISTWFGLFAPAQTPQPIVDQLHSEFVTAIESPAYAKLMEQLASTAMPTSQQEFSALIARDTQRYAQVIQSANVKAD